MTNPKNDVPHVVIIGAGFGGLRAAKDLRHENVYVTIIDKNNHHLFQPLLYQVATAGLSPADIAMPIRSVLRDVENIEVILGEVQRIDRNKNEVVLDDGTQISFDYLIVASGAGHSYFGNDSWAPFAPGLKTIDDATEVRTRILLAFENAERHHRDPDAESYLTFVIVGGGPTGVELAGAIAELSKQSLRADFRHIDPSKAQVILIEGGSRILSNFPEELSKKALRPLKKLGVQVRLNQRVTNITDSSVTAGQHVIPCKTVIWAAGVVASPLAKTLNTQLDSVGRVKVKPDLSIPENEKIYVVGDLAYVVQANGQPVPGVAPAAMQEGKYVAKRILSLVAGKSPTKNFEYLDKGNLATIGRAAAVADFGRLRLSGLIAWMAWLFIHVFFLIGFRNRIIVLFQWAWAYITFQRGARLITKAK